jgi:hypothetical protein
MNIRKTADDYEIITYLEPEVFILGESNMVREIPNV